MSSGRLQNVHTAYFGKIPGRGDFVKNASHPQLIASLDEWVAQAMQEIAKDPHWQGIYDALRPLRFSFLGSRSKLAIAGYLYPSHDQSGRRFPFLSATSLNVPNSTEFISRSPMAFSRMWNTMERNTANLVASEDPTEVLQIFDAMQGTIDADADDGFDAFLDLQTIERVTSMLRKDEHDIIFHDLVIALGLLLHPLMNSGASHAARGLLLPLPDDPLYMNLVAAYWLNLAFPFLARGDFEIAIFIGSIMGKSRLAIGLRGANSEELAGLMSTPLALEEQFLVMDDSSWINAHLHDSGRAKLSSYLQQPGLSLRTARDTFYEVFLGA